MRTTDRSIQTISIKDLAQRLELEFHGEGSLIVESVSAFETACASDLCFLLAPKYISQLLESHCGAVIVPVDFDRADTDKTLLFSKNPHLSFVKAIDILKPRITKLARIHHSASVSATAKIGEGVSIGANSVIEDDVTLMGDVEIGAGCIVEQGVTIGANTRLLSNVTICHDANIGQQVILHPGVVIGSDGFGLVYDQGDWVKIPQIGSVVIGDKVEIGANTTIDRGALSDTVIGNGVKLDNLIQVAHNVRIGDNTAIAACVGIAGSAIIGQNCKISGACTILGHLRITDNVTITAMSIVTKSITIPGTYSSGTPLMENRLWHRNNARYKTLDEMAKTLNSLKKED